MSKEYFDFKQFRIRHDKCGMKVGTDGVLLGAWAELDGCCASILDVGTGSGLISLMMAQRYPCAQVLAIDVDESSVGQARDNVLASRFADRVEVVRADVRSFEHAPFDHVVCNPPYYQEDTLPPDAQRALARNASMLCFEDLVRSVVRLLRRGGTFHVVLPVAAESRFRFVCGMAGLHLYRITRVKTVARKSPQRVLLSFVYVDKDKVPAMVEDELLLMHDGKRSEAYVELTRDFYL